MLFTALKRTINGLQKNVYGFLKDYLRLPKRLLTDCDFSKLPTTHFTKHQLSELRHQILEMRITCI